nr:hypothetical protein [Tanacetum cinerariifolium]
MFEFDYFLYSSYESGIFSGIRFRSPNLFDLLTKEDGKSILRDLQKSDVDADVENDYDETTTFVVSKSLGRIQALEQETRDLDVENKQMKVIKASYGVTTPQELLRNLIKARMVITIVTDYAVTHIKPISWKRTSTWLRRNTTHQLRRNQFENYK